jgi:transposase
MRDTALLQLALVLTAPWTVSRSDFDPSAPRLDIEIDFAPGSRVACPTCGAADCPAYDTERMTWRHLNFFQHQAYLNARVPRVRWVVHHYVDQARARTDASGVTRLAIDETAARRGHDYVTLFVDIDRERRVRNRNHSRLRPSIPAPPIRKWSASPSRNS